MKRYFITGTDTNCGKTYVTCELLRHMRERSVSAHAIKPVASGLSRVEDGWVNEDELHLLKANNNPLDVTLWTFRQPISPHLAASQEQVAITLEALVQFSFSASFEHLEYLFIEGAGGLMVPLNETHTWLDYLKLCRIPVILVIGMRLGCLNHGLLSAEVLKNHHIPCAGWIANCLDPHMLALESNIATLQSRLEFPLLAICPYQGTLCWQPGVLI